MASWDEFLDDGETVLWQGQPKPVIRMDSNAKIGLALGSVFVLYYIIGTIVRWPEIPMVQVVINLVMTCVGLWLMYEATLRQIVRRKRTWYTVTNKRAFVATDPVFDERKLAVHPITPQTPLTRKDDGILFGKTTLKTWLGQRKVPIGFFCLEDPDLVMSHLKTAQSRKSA